MTSLAEVQKSFNAALRNISISQRGNVQGPRSERFLTVYRDNTAKGLVSALASRYPVVKRLVGNNFFRTMAHAYLAAEPPRSPIMLYYGENLPRFIETHEPAQPVPYLAAIARLECARGLAYHAPSAGTVSATAFAAVSAEQLTQRVTLHPSVSIVTSPYPIYSIWSVNQTRAPTVPINPWAPEAALIARPLNTVEVTRLRPGEAEFLRSLADGASISDALETALGIWVDFDAPQALALLIKARVVTGFGPSAQGQRAN